MAKTVNQAFNFFKSEIVNLDPEQTKQARNSRDWLVGQINRFSDDDEAFPKLYSGKSIYYGSFARRTKCRPLDDIDIMVCYAGDGCTYEEFADRIEIHVPTSATRHSSYVNEGTNVLNSRKVINALVRKLDKVPQYKKAEIKRNLEAATLNLDSYDWVYDIVPCFLTAEDYYGRTYYLIPDGHGNWKKTDPRLDQARVNNVNQSHSGWVLDAIRVMKYWNVKNGSPIGSYLLENMILDYYESGPGAAMQFVDLNVQAILRDLITRIYSQVNDPKQIQGNLNTLSIEQKASISIRASEDSKKADGARQFESDGDHQKSIKKWKEIFGNSFPDYTI